LTALLAVLLWPQKDRFDGPRNGLLAGPFRRVVRPRDGVSRDGVSKTVRLDGRLDAPEAAPKRVLQTALETA
jgi:hypothetical protein